MPWETIRTITAPQTAETGNPEAGEFLALRGLGGVAAIKLINVNVTGTTEVRIHMFTEGEWSPIHDWVIGATPTVPLVEELFRVPSDAAYQLGVTVKSGTVNTMTVRVNPVMNVYL